MFGLKSIEAPGETFDEKLAVLETEHQSDIKLIEEEKTAKLQTATESVKERYANVLADVKVSEMAALSEATFCYNMLRLATDSRAPVMRTKVFSILQGWTPAENIGEFNEAIKEVEQKTGEKIIYDSRRCQPRRQGCPDSRACDAPQLPPVKLETHDAARLP